MAVPGNLTALVPAYNTMLNAELALQQKDSKLVGTVTTGPLNGEYDSVPIPTKRSMRPQGSTHEQLTPKESTVKWRRVKSSPWIDDAWFSNYQQIRSMLVNYASMYAQQQAMAANRTTDDIILAGLLGDAEEGADSKTFTAVPFDTSAYTNPTTGGAKLAMKPVWKAGINKLRRVLKENRINPSECTLATTSYAMQKLLDDGANQPWWNNTNSAVSEIIRSGEMGQLFGMNFVEIESTRLDESAAGSNKNYGVLYWKPAAKLLVAKEASVEIRKPEDRVDSYFLLQHLDKGLSRLVDRGVFLVEWDLS